MFPTHELQSISRKKLSFKLQYQIWQVEQEVQALNISSVCGYML